MRQLKLWVLFGEQKEFVKDVCKAKSTFVPSVNDPQLITFEKLVLRDIEQLENNNRTHVYKNLSRSEHQALNGLSKDCSIVIKQADKGGGIVIMDTEEYVEMVERLLKNETHYKKLSADPTDHIMNIIRIMVDEALSLGCINNSLSNFLKNKYPRVPVIYALPKVHKNIEPIPGRPIISGCSSVLEPLSIFLDQQIKHFVPQIKSYIKDTTHFIQTEEI